MDERIAERRRLRSALLVRLYQEVDGSVTVFVPAYELAGTLKMARPEAERAIAYLEEKGFVKVDDHRSGLLRLTAQGVDEVELGTMGNEAGE